MNAKTALLKILLSGETVNVKTCFRDTGLTNCSREVSRMVEKDFGVVLKREPKTGKSRYGCSVVWIDYSLPRTQENAQGINLIAKYIMDNNGNPKSGAKTQKQLNEK
jgi:hypothetical protein